MPELMCTPPLSAAVFTKSSIDAGCLSYWFAVPGAFIDRRAAWRVGPTMSSPISQSASCAVCFLAYCLASEPNTSDMDSFTAPDCPW